MVNLGQVNNRLIKLNENYLRTLCEDFKWLIKHPGGAWPSDRRAAYKQEIIDFFKDTDPTTLPLPNIHFPRETPDQKFFAFMFIAFLGSGYNSYIGEECLLDNLNSRFLLEKNKKWHKGFFDHFCKIHDKYSPSGQIGLMGQKIKAVAQLNEMLGEKVSLENLTKYKATLDELDQTLFNQKRNPTWDKFYNAVSLILFPLGLLRAADSYLRRGTSYFWLSNSEALTKASKDTLAELRQKDSPENDSEQQSDVKP